MYKHQEQVREFHEKFGLTINTKPTVPSEEVRKLRVRLLLEEVLEFAEAAGVLVDFDENGEYLLSIDGSGDLVLMADALADIQYVNDGAAVSCGLDLEPLADEVHRSNMSKLWPYCTHISRYLDIHELGLGVHSHKSALVSSYANNTACIELRPYKDEGGKVIKPPTYSPADIVGVLEKQML